jgi:hypothetical protein
MKEENRKHMLLYTFSGIDSFFLSSTEMPSILGLKQKYQSANIEGRPQKKVGAGHLRYSVVKV